MSEKTQIKDVDPAISRAISSGNIPKEDKDKVRLLVVTKAPYSKVVKDKTSWYLDLKCPCKKITTREFLEKPNGSFTVECDGCHQLGVVSIG